jgi:hypothetical protein
MTVQDVRPMWSLCVSVSSRQAAGAAVDVLAVGPAAVDAPLLGAVAHRSGGALMLHESARPARAQPMAGPGASARVARQRPQAASRDPCDSPAMHGAWRAHQAQ